LAFGVHVRFVGRNNERGRYMTTAHAPVRPRTTRRGGAWLAVLLLALAAAGLNALVWRVLHPPRHAPHVPAHANGVAYNAFGRWDSPLEGRMPAPNAVANDLAIVAKLTPRLRTYSAAELPDLPAAAQAHGLQLALGVWLDRRRDNNTREISAAIEAAYRHRAVRQIIAGNETQLLGTLAPHELHRALDHLRRAVGVPVSTAEPWHVWLRQPDLAKHVDFITVHLLPYWEGIGIDVAVDHAFARLRDLRKRFPGKRIVVGEIGWPSGGDTVGDAVASPKNQARFVREFLARAPAEGVHDYYLMEAVDQPWKRATEGRAGAHWGLLDASRRAKFEFEGPLRHDGFWSTKAAASSALGFLAAGLALLAWPRLRLRGRAVLALAVQGTVTAAVVVLSLPFFDYLRGPDVAALVLMVPAVTLMSLVVLVQVAEFAEMFWRRQLQGRCDVRPFAGNDCDAPFVSVHLACSNEPAAMVIDTIDSLLALDWPAFEVIVVDNNTRDEACWRPVHSHVDAWRARHPERARQLRFIHLPSWPGYKAGALNVALDASDERTQWVAIVDADYVVEPTWLRQVAGWFGFDDVGAVQAPQAHRDWQRGTLARMMNWEYDGFFRIGMHHRHERNAVIQHGTMTIVRARVLREDAWRESGEPRHGWNAACICEDTELGLRLLERGLRVLYVDRVFGTGLVPEDFDAYASQRRRWALGGMQILKRHARSIFAPSTFGPSISGPSKLSLAQRYHFVAGWLPWIGDAMHLVVTLAAMAWSLGVVAAPSHVSLPVALFAAPVAATFVVRLLLAPLLYRRNVPCALRDVAGAAVAGMALSHSVARGVFAGLLERSSAFDVTRKAGASSTNVPRARVPAREERLLLIGLAACGAALLIAEKGRIGPEVGAWLAVLAMQGVPYAMAWVCQRLGAKRNAVVAATPSLRPPAANTPQLQPLPRIGRQIDGNRADIALRVSHGDGADRRALPSRSSSFANRPALTRRRGP
jgi:exo-beta-1,3-glucanase (GH17 family)/cellulose synthase/poly-beta-1,6-N-acetylglucosamine synthase-like glycosyltransferase